MEEKTMETEVDRDREGRYERGEDCSFTTERQCESFSLEAPFCPEQSSVPKAICPAEHCAAYTSADPPGRQKRLRTRYVSRIR